MRQVKIIPTSGLEPHEMEATVNEAMQEIHQGGGYVEKTKYCVDKDGDLEMVIIEYEGVR